MTALVQDAGPDPGPNADKPFAPSAPLGKLVTPLEARDLPVHRWFLYPHSYSPGLVRELLRSFDLPPDAVVFDGFAGAGTTLRTAQVEGYSAFGVDMLPLSVLISNVKIAHYGSAELERAWSYLNSRLKVRSSNPQVLISDIPLVQRAFSTDIAVQLAHVRQCIAEEQSSRLRSFFLVALAALVEEVSLAIKSGGWPRLVDRQIEPNTVVPKFVERVQQMICDVRESIQAKTHGRWRCYQGDSRHVPPVQRITAAISSPPYLNRHDYTRVLALEHAVTFDTLQSEIIGLRRKLLRSHVEARRREMARGYRVPAALADLLPELSAAKHTDPRVMPMITGYFEDLFLSLRALRRRLVKGGFAAYVLGDVRFAGIMLPVDTIVRELGEQVGLSWCVTWEARQRGNSAQQMRNFGREPAREHVTIWQAHAAK